RLQPCPLVDAPRTLHEQRFDADPREQPLVADLAALLELEVPLIPRHDLIDRLLHLESELTLQLFLADTAHLEQDLGEPPCRIRTLQLERAVQLALCQLARADQQLTEPPSRTSPDGEH